MRTSWRQGRLLLRVRAGGTYAAFTWGVLTRILETKKAWDANPAGGDSFEIEAISGTSAGALCALATGYGLAPNTADSAYGTIDKAIERLNHLWTVFAATKPVETAHNAIVGALLDLAEAGAPFPSSSPYGEFGDFAITGLRMLGAHLPRPVDSGVASKTSGILGRNCRQRRPARWILRLVVQNHPRRGDFALTLLSVRISGPVQRPMHPALFGCC